MAEALKATAAKVDHRLVVRGLTPAQVRADLCAVKAAWDGNIDGLWRAMGVSRSAFYAVLAGAPASSGFLDLLYGPEGRTIIVHGRDDELVVSVDTTVPVTLEVAEVDPADAPDANSVRIEAGAAIATAEERESLLSAVAVADFDLVTAVDMSMVIELVDRGSGDLTVAGNDDAVSLPVVPPPPAVETVVVPDRGSDDLNPAITLLGVERQRLIEQAVDLDRRAERKRDAAQAIDLAILKLRAAS